MSYIPTALQSWSVGGVQAGLAAVYESRVHTISKMTVARAQFAGDTNVSLTDGSYNIRTKGLVSSGAIISSSGGTGSITVSGKFNITAPSSVVVNGVTLNVTTITTTATTTTLDLKNTSATSVTISVGNAVPFTPTAVPVSSTAVLANSTNTYNSGLLAPKNSWGKPVVVKVKRDEQSSEILSYGVFNADGTIPGSDGTLGQDAALDPWSATARYLVNPATGEIYVNNSAKMIELKNPDGIVNFQFGTYNTGANANIQETIAGADQALLQGKDKVVGMVDFEGLQGGALSLAQQQASDLSAVIQSLTSTLRATNDSKKSILSLIK